MTDNDQQQEQSEKTGLVSRRQIIAALGSAGLFGGLAASGQQQSNPHNTSSRATLGGGPMSSQTSHMEIQWIEESFTNRPSPGVEGRYFRVDDPNDSEFGHVYRDTGSAWELIDLGVETLSTEIVGIENSAVGKLQASSRADTDTHDGTFSDPYTKGVQKTLDYLSNKYGSDQQKQIIIDGRYDETVVIDENDVMLTSPHWTNQIRPSSPTNHVVDINHRDVVLDGLTIYQNNSSYDTIYIDDSAGISTREIRIEDCGIEGSAGRHAIYAKNTNRVRLKDIEIGSWPGDTAINIEGCKTVWLEDVLIKDAGINLNFGCRNIRIRGVEMETPPANEGIFINAPQAQISDIKMYNPESAGVNIQGDQCNVSGTVVGADQNNNGRGAVEFDNCTGSQFRGTISGSNSEDVIFFDNATECAVYGPVTGDVTFETGATDCKVIGSVGGTVTNNGTNCNVIDS